MKSITPQKPLDQMLLVSTMASLYDIHTITATHQPWPELIKHLKTPGAAAKNKFALPLLKLAKFGDKRNEKGNLRHNDNVESISGIEADYDGEEMTIEQAAELLAAAGVEAFLYSSPSHMNKTATSKGGPRWRALCPLTKEYPPESRREFVGRLNRILGGVLAGESFALSQTFFYGCVEGVPYETRHVAGACLDELAGIASLYPVGSGVTEQTALEKREMRDPTTKPGLIGAFNQHCDDLSIHAAVAEYLSDVLEPLDDEKHFNLIGHAGRGVFITDDGKHLCGNHDSWVGGSNRAMNMWDVVRHFKFDGPADDALEPFGQRASDRAMTEWAGAQHLVAEIQDRRVAIAMSAALDLGSVESMVAEHGTEHAVALAFTMRYDGVVKFDYQSGSWLQYTGTHWSKQTTGLVSHYCRQMAASLGKKCQRSGFISGVEKLAKTDPRMASDSAFFDHDNYLFNCPDGTYDLRDGTRREHRPSDLLTNIAEVAPAAPGDYGERFPQFLNEVTQGETEMATFLQVSLGACLSGALENHHLMFLIGNGRNGKNTLGDLVMEVMGSYARKIPNNVLMKSKNERHPAEIADLKGARLVVASEIDQGAHWDEARINELTGDTRIKARFMHGNPFEFNRTFKILIYGNHRPRLQSATDAMRSRLKIVRFGASFLGREDPDLPAKLRSERGNVLRWLLDGHKMWIDAGKKLPDFAAMREELEDYVDAQGTIKNWIDETLLIIGLGDGGPWLKARDGYHFYQVWKEARGETSFSMTVWGEEMSKHFQKKKARDGNFYSARLISPGDSLLQ